MNRKFGISATLVASVALVLVSAASAAGGPTGAPLASFPITDGGVEATLLSGSTLYIGGSFSQVGPNTGGFASVDTSTAKPSTAIPPTDGTVYATASDGAGGWFIGGDFSHVGSVTRSNLAHIWAGGDVDLGFDPAPDGDVRSLELTADGTTLYVGGNFFEIGGQIRNYLAALSAANGTATSFDAGADGVPLALALSSDGATLYVGGIFGSLGGQFRNFIGAVSTATGTATSFNPFSSSYVRALALTSDDSVLYAGGDFTTIGGQFRNSIGAFQTSGNGSATGFNPNALSTDGNGTHVDALVLSSDDQTLYVGGHFTDVGGAERHSIAALDTSLDTNNATAFNPAPTAPPSEVPIAYALALSSDEQTVYAGGKFITIGGQSRANLAAVSAADGTATAFDPRTDQPVRALILSGSTLGVGGQFTSVGVQARHNLAAIDLSTGELTSFNPNVNGGVSTLALSGTTLYAGGGFTSIDSQTRKYIAAFDTSAGTLTSFNPNANNNVLTLALSSDGATLYAGGYFVKIGAQTTQPTRNHLAALDTSTGDATSFDPNADFSVYALALSSDDNTLYAGGAFSTIGGQTRSRLAALATSTGNATGFDPAPNSDVYALELDGSTLYAGGYFSSIGGQTRNGIAALATADGTATLSFNPNANDLVASFALSSDGSVLYAGGAFTSIGGQSRNRIAALQTSTGNATSFDPNADEYVSTLALSGDDSTLYAGGYFTNVGGAPRQSLAAFPDFPETTIDSGPAASIPAGSTSTFTFSSDTGGATFECSLDFGAFSSCGSPNDYPGLSSGPHTFAVRSSSGGFTDQTPASQAWTILSADGSGTMTASPSAVSASATKQTLKFVYTAATGGISNGEVRVTVPSGWSAPSQTGTDPGFVTSSAGSVALANRTIVVSGLSRAGGQSVTITYGAKTSGGPGATAPSTTGAQSWPAQAKSTAAGTLKNLASSPAITIYARDGSGTLTSSKAEVSALWAHQTIKFTYTTAAGGIAGGQLRITVPAGWSAPSTNGSAAGYTTASPGTLTISSRTIVVSGLTRTAGQQVTVTYGSRALGGPGATAPTTTGLQIWQAQEQSAPGGTPKNLASSPSIRVYARDGSGTLTTPTTSVVHGSTGKTIVFTYTAAVGGIKNGQVTLAVPAGWSAPSTSGAARGFVKASLGSVSISSRTIVVSGLTRAGGQTFTITYGSKASGGPGASAPTSAVGTQTWQAKERSLPGGVLTNLGSSPRITVT